MKAAKILGLIIAGGILGFLFWSIGYKGQELIADVSPKQVKPAKKAKKTTTINKTRKKKEESK